MVAPLPLADLVATNKNAAMPRLLCLTLTLFALIANAAEAADAPVFEGIGRGSCAPVSMSFGQLWSFRDGLVERIDVGEPDQTPDLARD